LCRRVSRQIGSSTWIGRMAKVRRVIRWLSCLSPAPPCQHYDKSLLLFPRTKLLNLCSVGRDYHRHSQWKIASRRLHIALRPNSLRSGSECLAKGDISVEPIQILGGDRSRVEEAILGLEECDLTRRIVFGSRKSPIPVSPGQRLEVAGWLTMAKVTIDHFEKT